MPKIDKVIEEPLTVHEVREWNSSKLLERHCYKVLLGHWKDDPVRSKNMQIIRNEIDRRLSLI